MTLKKKIFGGMKLDFSGRDGDKDTLESIFGKKNIPPTEMMKRIWTYIKRRPDIKVVQ
jgi:hypothetical protein